VIVTPTPTQDTGVGPSATRVKICGVRTRRDVALVSDAGADAVGFVTEVPVDTHRDLTRDETADLVSGAPPFLTTVAVVMPDDEGHAVGLARDTGADAVQLHNGVGVEEVARRTDAAVIEAIGPDETPSGAADAAIVDSTDADGAGGTGETVDWGGAADLVDRSDTPVVLAGGLTPSNVPDAVRRVSPYAVDVSSGVEDEDGTKDPDLVHGFVTAARGAYEDGGDAPDV